MSTVELIYNRLDPPASGDFMLSKNPVLNLPLSDVMRSEIALPLQFILKLHTVGCLLNAWRNPRNHGSIEQVFDSPQQARHAVATCAAWIGVQTAASSGAVAQWWVTDEQRAASCQPVEG